jgi:hypothetical protein
MTRSLDEREAVQQTADVRTVRTGRDERVGKRRQRRVSFEQGKEDVLRNKKRLDSTARTLSELSEAQTGPSMAKCVAVWCEM